MSKKFKSKDSTGRFYIYDEKATNHFLSTYFKKEALKLLKYAVSYVIMYDKNRGRIFFSASIPFNLSGWTKKDDEYFNNRIHPI